MDIFKLLKSEKVDVPKWLPDNMAYMNITGSYSYGVSTDLSDMDIIGFCVPPLGDVFPHKLGYIAGFGTPPSPFGVFSKHHVMHEETEYDFTLYSIVKYFHLCMEMNPNMIDSLFVDRDCIIHITKIGEMVRSARKTFLHKGAYQRFRGYAYAQMSKIDGHKKTEIPDNIEKILNKIYIKDLLDMDKEIIKRGL